MKLRKTLVALGAAAALTLTACGSAEDSTDGGDSGGSSSGGSSSTEASSGGLTQDSFASSVSDAQAEAQSAHMEMSIEAMGQTIEGSGDVSMDPGSKDPKDAKLAMTMDVPQLGELDMRLVDGVAYIKMGSFTEGKFVEMDLTSKDNPLGQSLDDLTKQADPNAMVDQLAGSLKDFEKTDETEEIDGVETTKYVLTIDGKEIESLAGAQGGSLGSQGSADLPDEVKADAWVGDDNLLRKMTMDIEQGSSPMSMEMTFTDWGEPIVVEAPPDSEITENSMFDDKTAM